MTFREVHEHWGEFIREIEWQPETGREAKKAIDMSLMASEKIRWKKVKNCPVDPQPKFKEEQKVRKEAMYCLEMRDFDNAIVKFN